MTYTAVRMHKAILRAFTFMWCQTSDVKVSTSGFFTPDCNALKCLVLDGSESNSQFTRLDDIFIFALKVPLLCYLCSAP
jgi:hypothetical protein